MVRKDIKHKLLVYTGLVLIVETVSAWFFKSGPNLGTFFPAMMGVFLILSALFRKSNFYNRNKKKLSGIKKAAIIMAAIWFVSFLLIEASILFSAFNNQIKRTDALLILGAGLHGSKLSLVLKERLDKGLNYLEKYPAAVVVVSGGKGIGEDISEAEAMKRYLVRMGISREHIIKEERATSTMENFKYSKELLEKQGMGVSGKLTVITSDFHMFRTKFLARRAGLKAYGITSRSPFYLLPNLCLREYFAVIKSFVFDRY